MIGGFQVGPFQTDYQQQTVINGLSVPNCIGLYWYAAVELLGSVGLDTGVPQQVKNTSYPQGLVIGQNPVAGTIVPVNSFVMLVAVQKGLLSVSYDLTV